MASTTASKPTIPLVCAQCGTTFYVHPYRVKAGARYCSQRCDGRARSAAHNTPESFWAKVAISDDPTACWPWKRGRSDNGFGMTRWEREDIGPHIVAFRLTYGAVPAGLQVNHSCPMYHCCNPAHLYAGTPGDAMRERQKRGHCPEGDAHHWTKITVAQHADILRMRLELRWTWDKIGAELGVTTNALIYVAQKHIPAALRGRLYPDKRTGKRAWRKANPDKARAERMRRRMHEANAPYIEDVSTDVLYKRDRGICQICYKRCARKDASCDHVIPISKGGAESYQNCVLAHLRCNSKKNNGTKIPQQQRLFG